MSNLLNIFLTKIAFAKKMKQILPTDLKKIGRKFLPFEEYTKQYWLAQDEYRDIEEVSCNASKHKVAWGYQRNNQIP